MPDPASIAGAITSVKTAIDIVKLVRETDAALEKAETKNRLADLMLALADAKTQLVDVQEALASATARIAELERALQQREELTFKGEAYWRIRNGEPDEGPYCPKCYLERGRVAPMTDRGNGYTCCVVCDSCIGRGRTPHPYSVNREDQFPGGY